MAEEESRLKIVLPMAGRGVRLRPHTWSRPKGLLHVAGRPFIHHVLDRLDSLPPTMPREYVWITGADGGELEAHLRQAFPDRKQHFAAQAEPLGQSHALYQAREYLAGPLLMVFPDTLIETDLRFLGSHPSEAFVWIREVPDPERFGIAQTGPDGRVERIVEKPQSKEHRLAVVGYYYFPEGAALIDAIEEQLVNDLRTGDEFYLAGAINLLLGRGLPMRPLATTAWYDGGDVPGLLETNAYLLAGGGANFRQPINLDGTQIKPPVYIHPSAVVEGSSIGPNVAIEAGCRVVDSVVENSILAAGASIAGCRLRDSLIGERVRLSGVTGIISAGDDSSYEFN